MSGGGGAEYLGGDVLANLLGPFFPALVIAVIIYYVFKRAFRKLLLLKRYNEDFIFLEEETKVKEEMDHKAHLLTTQNIIFPYLLIFSAVMSFSIFVEKTPRYVPFFELENYSIILSVALVAAVPFGLIYLTTFYEPSPSNMPSNNTIRAGDSRIKIPVEELIALVALVIAGGIVGIFIPCHLKWLSISSCIMLGGSLITFVYIHLMADSIEEVEEWPKKAKEFGRKFVPIVIIILLIFAFLLWLYPSGGPPLGLLIRLVLLLTLPIFALFVLVVTFGSIFEAFIKIMKYRPPGYRTSPDAFLFAIILITLVGLSSLLIDPLNSMISNPSAFKLYVGEPSKAFPISTPPPFTNLSYLSCSYPTNESKLDVTLRVENYLPNIIAVRGGIVEGDKIIGKLSPIKRVPFNRTGEVYNTTVTLTFNDFNYSEYAGKGDLKILVKAWDIYGNKILPFTVNLTSCTPSNISNNNSSS